MKIKSVTDVITNSSSEVFIIRKDRALKEISDPMEMISNLFSAVGFDVEKKLSWETSKKDGKALEGIPSSKCSKGDLIITKPENIYVPNSLLKMIEELGCYDKSIKSVERIKY